MGLKGTRKERRGHRHGGVRPLLLAFQGVFTGGGGSGAERTKAGTLGQKAPGWNLGFTIGCPVAWGRLHHLSEPLSPPKPDDLTGLPEAVTAGHWPAHPCPVGRAL